MSDKTELIEEPEEKRCEKCLVVKPLNPDEFRYRSTSGTYSKNCLECIKLAIEEGRAKSKKPQGRPSQKTEGKKVTPPEKKKAGVSPLVMKKKTIPWSETLRKETIQVTVSINIDPIVDKVMEKIAKRMAQRPGVA